MTIDTEQLEKMASNGNEVARLALFQRRELAELKADVANYPDPDSELGKAEITIRNLTIELGRMRDRIAELETGPIVAHDAIGASMQFTTQLIDKGARVRILNGHRTVALLKPRQPAAGEVYRLRWLISLPADVCTMHDHAWRFLDQMCRDERARLAADPDAGGSIGSIAAFDSLDAIESVIPAHIAAEATVREIDGEID